MSLEDGIFYVLTTNPRLYALVAERVYPSLGVPARTPMPYVAYKLVGGVFDTHQTAQSDMHETRYQFDCVAATRTAADALCEAVKRALAYYSGAVPTGETILSSVMEMEVTLLVQLRFC